MIAEAVVAAEEHQEVDVVPHAEVDAVVLVPEVAQRPLLYVDPSAIAHLALYTYTILGAPSPWRYLRCPRKGGHVGDQELGTRRVSLRREAHLC